MVKEFLRWTVSVHLRNSFTYKQWLSIATHLILKVLFVFFCYIPTVAYLETTTVRVPSRHHSISTSIETMPTKADVTLQRLHDDDDSDVTQSCPPLSPQNQPFSGTDDAATASTVWAVLIAHWSAMHSVSVLLLRLWNLHRGHSRTHIRPREAVLNGIEVPSVIVIIIHFSLVSVSTCPYKGIVL